MKINNLGKILGLLLVGLLFFTSCSSVESPSTNEDGTVTVKDNELTVSAGISKSNPEKNIESVESLVLKHTPEETQTVLLRMPLPAGISSDELISASLRLKKKSGDTPTLQATAITNPWDRLEVTWNSLEDAFSELKTDGITAKSDGDWYSIDITEIAKGWLSGDTGNYGMMLEETQTDKETTFFSSYESLEECPELILTYSKKDILAGKFDYQQQESGNCLSFALRDKSPILAEDLQLDDQQLQKLYQEKGLDSAADYVEELALAYIQEHKEELQIRHIRKLSSFDEEINPETEYRIVTKIGAEENYDGSLNFDYHWQVQLPDGSWAEKFGFSNSRIVPGSNKALDPGLYPWDQNEYWGMQKWTAFYDSKPAYYAVEKERPAFTTHRPGSEVAPVSLSLY